MGDLPRAIWCNVRCCVNPCATTIACALLFAAGTKTRSSAGVPASGARRGPRRPCRFARARVPAGLCARTRIRRRAKRDERPARAAAHAGGYFDRSRRSRDRLQALARAKRHRCVAAHLRGLARPRRSKYGGRSACGRARDIRTSDRAAHPPRLHRASSSRCRATRVSRRAARAALARCRAVGSARPPPSTIRRPRFRTNSPQPRRPVSRRPSRRARDPVRSSTSCAATGRSKSRTPRERSVRSRRHRRARRAG